MLLIVGIFTGLSLFFAVLYLADFSALQAWLRTREWGNKDAKERYIEQARRRKDLDEILRGRWF